MLSKRMYKTLSVLINHGSKYGAFIYSFDTKSLKISKSTSTKTVQRVNCNFILALTWLLSSIVIMVTVSLQQNLKVCIQTGIYCNMIFYSMEMFLVMNMFTKNFIQFFNATLGFLWYFYSKWHHFFLN